MELLKKLFAVFAILFSFAIFAEEAAESENAEEAEEAGEVIPEPADTVKVKYSDSLTNILADLGDKIEVDADTFIIETATAKIKKAPGDPQYVLARQLAYNDTKMINKAIFA